MATIELNENTANEVHRTAQLLGMSVEALIRSRVLGHSLPQKSRHDFDLDAELDALAVSVSPLPATFSRLDIYPDTEISMDN